MIVLWSALALLAFGASFVVLFPLGAAWVVMMSNSPKGRGLFERALK